MQARDGAIRFGVQVGGGRTTFQDYLERWQLCERLGYDIAYVTDHMASYSPEFGVVPVFEGPTLLSAMASQTTRMRCGFMVAGNTFRNPAILAKIAVTLDHVSNGRFELGMGSGHIKFEHEQYNIPYYTQGRRIRMLGEAARIVRSLLREERTTFQGEYYTLTEAYCEPKPVQQQLPILIGGIGETLTLRIVAESADIWNNWTTPDLDTYQEKLSALERHCQVLGRDPRTIRRSLHIKPLIVESASELPDRALHASRSRSQGTIDEVTDYLLSFAKLGVQDFVFMLDSEPDLRSLELLATSVAPRIREAATGLSL